MRIRILLPLLILLASCATHNRPAARGGMEYAQWLDLQENQAVILSPYGGAPDTLKVDSPVRSIVCMSCGPMPSMWAMTPRSITRPS